MTANPFNALNWSGMKSLHNDMIDSVITNMAVTCQIIHPPAFTDCSNCGWDAVGNKSNNVYASGGPMPFRNGQTCPMCMGSGKLTTEETENVSLVVLWDESDWLPIQGGFNVKVQDGMLQTWGLKATYAKIKEAKEIIIDTSLNNLHVHRYVREGEPWWCGFGESRYSVCMWREAGSGS
jgi:hypothetical protein